MTDANHLLTHTERGVLTVTWNRPDKKNALTGAMYEALVAALKQAEADPAVRVVAITGAGKDFTAGNDMGDFASWGHLKDPMEIPVIKAMFVILNFPKPLVAATRGNAVGIGTTLLLHCDAVLASRTTRFAMPFVSLGLVPEFGSSHVLPRLAGHVRASHVLLTGEPFDVAAASAMGIVSEVCDDEQLEPRLAAVCERLAGLPPAALRATKALLRPAAEKQRISQAIELEMKAFMAGITSPEHHEAVAAFKAKRAADFARFA